jgi:hypothetical protein
VWLAVGEEQYLKRNRKERESKRGEEEIIGAMKEDIMMIIIFCFSFIFYFNRQPEIKQFNFKYLLSASNILLEVTKRQK